MSEIRADLGGGGNGGVGDLSFPGDGGGTIGPSGVVGGGGSPSVPQDSELELTHCSACLAGDPSHLQPVKQ